MTRIPEMFAIGAIVLLVFALFSRFIGPPVSISVQWRGTGYLFPPASVGIAFATFLCLFAAVYSIWMVPMSEKWAMWHFWLTSVGIGMFWLSFYRLVPVLSDPARATKLSGLTAAAAWGQIISIAVLLMAQAIFILNFIQAIAKTQRFRS